jgi:hypothetical protein
VIDDLDEDGDLDFAISNTAVWTLTEFHNFDSASDPSASHPPGCERCPADPEKLEAGICGDGERDVDSHGDGTLDCDDGCRDDPYQVSEGVCGCGVGDPSGDGGSGGRKQRASRRRRRCRDAGRARGLERGTCRKLLRRSRNRIKRRSHRLSDGGEQREQR